MKKLFSGGIKTSIPHMAVTATAMIRRGCARWETQCRPEGQEGTDDCYG